MTIKTKPLVRAWTVFSLLSLLILVYLAKLNAYFPWDLLVTRYIQSLHFPGFDVAMRVISWPGYPPQAYILVIFPVATLYFLHHRWEATVQLISSVIFSSLFYTLKFFVNRPRPDPNLVRVIHPGLEGGHYSFPAGHVQVYTAIFGFLLFLCYVLLPKNSWSRKIQILIYALLIILIGLSRVYSGEHWASDALGGYFVGSIWLSLTIFIYLWGKKRIV